MVASGESRADVWRRRAQRASDEFGLVLALVALTYVVASLLSNRGWSAVLIALSTSATAVVGLASSHVRQRAVRRTLLVAALALLLAVISAVTGTRACLAVASVLEAVLLAVSMAAVLRRVVSHDEVSTRTILGAVSVYASLGILFTWIYAAIDKFEGGHFFAGLASAKGSDLIFFSFTTLTTTGYGNLVPASHTGRMVSGLEAMIGQIFLVTMVAGLVSLWRPGQSVLTRRLRRRGGSGEEPGITP